MNLFEYEGKQLMGRFDIPVPQSHLLISADAPAPMDLPFVLKAADRQALCNALVKEYGAAQGSALYNHLKAIFQAPEAPAEPEEKPAKTSRPHRNYRRKKAAVEKAAE